MKNLVGYFFILVWLFVYSLIVYVVNGWYVMCVVGLFFDYLRCCGEW